MARITPIDLSTQPPSPLCGCPEHYCELEDSGMPASEARKVLTGFGQRCQRELREEQQTKEMEALNIKREGGRPSRDEFFMRLAELAAERSTCLRGHTGAVIVADRHVVSLGYNGSPPGLLHCTEVGCEGGKPTGKTLPTGEPELHFPNGCQRTVHAELNAIAHAARHGISTEGCIMYTLSAPCLKCAQAILSAGIVELVWKNEYRADRLDLLEEAGIRVRRV